jgi:hypothetical protein
MKDKKNRTLPNKYKDGGAVNLSSIPKSKTNKNSQWYGTLGVSPINYVQTKSNSTQYRILKAPPVQIPLRLFDEYTLGGKVDFRWWYCNQETPPTEDSTFNEMFADLEKEDPFEINTQKLIAFEKDEVDRLISEIKDKRINYYGDVSRFMYDAFEKFPIKDKTVAIMGSTHPVCEAFAISYGAKPNTIEYTDIKCQDERIRTFTVDEYYSLPDEERPRFDAGISISSFEHDGLGKYGDPLDPSGDLAAMKRMKDTIKKDGILYLAVPCGKDRIDWNAHRVYGEIRIPMLLDGWELIGAYGMSEKILSIVPFHDLEERKGYGYTHCLFILKNT